MCSAYEVATAHLFRLDLFTQLPLTFSTSAFLVSIACHNIVSQSHTMQLEADIANLREISELQEARCIELNAMLGDRDQTLEISQVSTLKCTVMYRTALINAVVYSSQLSISDPKSIISSFLTYLPSLLLSPSPPPFFNTG